MALARILEPEVMDTEEEAHDYDAMDHQEVNDRFCADLLALCPDLRGRVLDLGTGTALIPVELCRRVPHIHVEGVDLAHEMLALARRNVERAGLGSRITLTHFDAKSLAMDSGSFDAVLSNSVMHHVPRPEVALSQSIRLARRGGIVFVRDLVRPENDDRLAQLVATYASVPANGDDAIRRMHERQRALFAASLRAALTTDEVRALVGPLGVPPHAVQMTSDRHWTLAHVKP